MKHGLTKRSIGNNPWQTQPSFLDCSSLSTSLSSFPRPRKAAIASFLGMPPSESLRKVTITSVPSLGIVSSLAKTSLPSLYISLTAFSICFHHLAYLHLCMSDTQIFCVILTFLTEFVISTCIDSLFLSSSPFPVLFEVSIGHI